MNRITLIICLHQIVFQAMFALKNILLKRRLARPIRGSSRQVNLSILFFAGFIALAIFLSLQAEPAGTVGTPGEWAWFTPALACLFLSLLIAAAALIHLRESWRVGIVAAQKTELVTTGIYGISRNPYFVSYILMFLGYALLLQNLILLGLTLAGGCLVHAMIRKEEEHLKRAHTDAYAKYCTEVPRYLLF